MVLVEVACTKCGLVRLDIKKFSLFVNEKGESFFTFVCPSCVEVNRYPADDYIVEVLTYNGILPHIWEPARELAEPKKGLKISYDDILDFHMELQRKDWFEILIKEKNKNKNS
jgi:hypothetical protein